MLCINVHIGFRICILLNCQMLHTHKSIRTLSSMRSCSCTLHLCHSLSTFFFSQVIDNGMLYYRLLPNLFNKQQSQALSDGNFYESWLCTVAWMKIIKLFAHFLSIVAWQKVKIEILLSFNDWKILAKWQICIFFSFEEANVFKMKFN